MPASVPSVSYSRVSIVTHGSTSNIYVYVHHTNLGFSLERLWQRTGSRAKSRELEYRPKKPEPAPKKRWQMALDWCASTTITQGRLGCASSKISRETDAVSIGYSYVAPPFVHWNGKEFSKGASDKNWCTTTLAAEG